METTKAWPWAAAFGERKHMAMGQNPNRAGEHPDPGRGRGTPIPRQALRRVPRGRKESEETTRPRRGAVLERAGSPPRAKHLGNEPS